MVGAGRLRATDQLRRARAPTDAIVICVPTPLTANRQPDLGAVVDAATSLSRVLRRGQLVVLESTTYPGTTRERLVPLLEESGLAAGRDFHVAYSPERVDPGRTDFTLRNTVKVDRRPDRPPARERRAQLYERVVRRRAGRLDAGRGRAGEAAREHLPLGEHRARERAGGAVRPDGHRRLGGRSTPRRPSRSASCGSTPGPGMGGHCLPVDPFYLAWRAREFDFYTEFIELAGKINQSMPYFCVDKIERTLNDHGKAVNGVAHPAAGRRLQAGRRRHARVARAQDPPAAERARRERLLPRPARALAARAVARVGAAGPRARGSRPGRDRHRPSRRSTTAAWPRRRSWCSTSAASRGTSSRAIWCACDGPRRLDQGRDIAVGVVGLGYWGPNLARNFAALEGCELRWCCDRSDGGARALGARRFPARASPPISSDLLADPELDAVVVATTSPRTRALACAGAGGRQALLRREAAGAVGRGGRGGGRGGGGGRTRSLMVGHLLEYHPGVAQAEGDRRLGRARRRLLRLLEPAQPRQDPRGRERALEPRRARRLGPPAPARRGGAGRGARARRVVRARRGRGRRVLLPALPLRAASRTCTSPGSTRTRSGGSRWSARSGWRPSTTWRSSAS